MGFDPIWKHATKVGSGFCCNYCKETFEKGGSKQVKWHLGKVDGVGVRACPVVSEQVSDEAIKALAPKRKRTNDVLCLPAPPSSGRHSTIFDQIYDLMFDLVGKDTVILRLATAIMAYVRGNGAIEELTNGPDAIEFRFHKGCKLDSIDFKRLLGSYHDITVLLGIMGSDVAFHKCADDVLQGTGGDEYRKIVDFVVLEADFWSSCDRIVERLAPLFEVLVVLSASGTTIGHVVRCFESAMVQHAGVTEADECFGKLKEFYEGGINRLSVAAAAMDPSLVRLRRGEQCDFLTPLGKFSDFYVLHDYEEPFMADVGDYLKESDKLYHCSALDSRALHHPGKFWFWTGQGLPTLRSYALKAVTIEYGTTQGDVEKHMCSDREVGEDEVHFSGRRFHCYSEELRDAFIKKVGVSGGDYLQIWGRLKKLGQVGWEIVAQKQFDLFLLHIDGFLA